MPENKSGGKNAATARLTESHSQTPKNMETSSQEKSKDDKNAKPHLNGFGQVVPMCSDAEWLAAEAAMPSSQLNIAKKQGKVSVFATPSSQKRIKRKALNQGHAEILGKLVTDLVGQLLESKEGTEVEVHVKIGGHAHDLIRRALHDAPLPRTPSPVRKESERSRKSERARRSERDKKRPSSQGQHSSPTKTAMKGA